MGKKICFCSGFIVIPQNFITRSTASDQLLRKRKQRVCSSFIKVGQNVCSHVGMHMHVSIINTDMFSSPCQIRSNRILLLFSKDMWNTHCKSFWPMPSCRFQPQGNPWKGEDKLPLSMAISKFDRLVKIKFSNSIGIGDSNYDLSLKVILVMLWNGVLSLMGCLGDWKSGFSTLRCWRKRALDAKSNMSLDK